MLEFFSLWQMTPMSRVISLGPSLFLLFFKLLRLMLVYTLIASAVVSSRHYAPFSIELTEAFKADKHSITAYRHAAPFYWPSEIPSLGCCFRCCSYLWCVCSTTPAASRLLGTQGACSEFREHLASSTSQLYGEKLDVKAGHQFPFSAN